MRLLSPSDGAIDRSFPAQGARGPDGNPRPESVRPPPNGTEQFARRETGKLADVEGDLPSQATNPAEERYATSGRARIEQGQQCDGVPLCLELPRHLEGDHAPEAIAGQAVRAFRLKLADLPSVMRGDVLDQRREGLSSIQRESLESVDGLPGTQHTREVVIAEHVAHVGMDTEQRRLVASGLNGHERRPARRRQAVLPERARQLFDRRCPKERGHRKAPAEALLDPGK